MKYIKGIKYVMLLVAFLYILGIFVFPFMEHLKYNWIAWVVLGIYLLNLIFLWAIDAKKKNIEEVDREEATKEAKISQELLRDRNKWVV